MARFDLLDRRELAFNVSALVNGGLGVVRAPDPDDRDHPGGRRLDRLRYGVAANVRWKDLDVYGALIWDQLYGLPGELRSEEHTSELQSQSNLVCRLLLEKKKNKT